MKAILWPFKVLVRPIWDTLQRFFLLLRMQFELVSLSTRGMRKSVTEKAPVEPATVAKEKFQAAWGRAHDPFKSIRNLRLVAYSAWLIAIYSLAVGAYSLSGGALFAGVIILVMAVMVFHYPLWQVQTQGLYSYGTYLRTLPYEPGLLWQGLTGPLPNPKANPPKDTPDEQR